MDIVMGNNTRTTIAIHRDTKDLLDSMKVPGQCYDNFLSEIIEYWERYRVFSSLCGPGKPVRLDADRPR